MSPLIRRFFILTLLAGIAGAFLAGCASDKNRPVSRNLRKRTLPVERSQVELVTNLGTIIVELFHNEAPETVENFRQYVKDGHYDNTLFHRVVKDFVVQGGGYVRGERGLVERPTRDPIDNEANNGLRNRRGTLSMARTTDKDSATSQFFINLSDNEVLDHGVQSFGYCVFGRVIQGMAVVERIGQVDTISQLQFTHLPREDVLVVAARTLRVSEFVEPEPMTAGDENQDQLEKEENEEKEKKFLGVF
jgi:cyclophilin family peptidyl-prolyl cis-trans isomerase